MPRIVTRWPTMLDTFYHVNGSNSYVEAGGPGDGLQSEKAAGACLQKEAALRRQEDLQVI